MHKYKQMGQLITNKYDAVIIGAGISGLVCGCYLAKAGMKVLIVEQHHKPGGYCTSFKREGYNFDAAAHSIGGCRNNGNMNKILVDLELSSRINMKRYEPSDVIIAPDYKIHFWSDVSSTMRELQLAFPNESKGIDEFIHFLLNHEPIDFVTLRKKTFKNLLDHYFTDDKLKAILSFPLLGNGDLPPSLISAFVGAKIFSEFLLDGGYYPNGGMQVLPNLLSERFKEFGGDMLLSQCVTKIGISGNKVTGIYIKNNEFVQSTFVISNCDGRQTFSKLIGRKFLSTKFVSKLDSMVPSQSIFVLYLGIDSCCFNDLPEPGSNNWYLPDYNLEDLYLSAKKVTTNNFPKYYMVRFSPDKKTILAFVNVPFKNRTFWKNNKKTFLEIFIAWIERTTIPNLSKHIIYKEAATPYTMFRYTLNYHGAAYGWAGVPSQFADPDFRNPSFLNGLYLTGHWTTYAQGLPGVAYLGYDTAMILLKKRKIN